LGTDATGLVNDTCASYSFNVQVDGGSLQIVSFPGDQAQTFDDLIVAINADLTGALATISSGDLVIVSDVLGQSSHVVVSNDGMFNCLNTFVDIGSETIGVGSCELYAKHASATEAGVVQIGSGITVDGDGVISIAGAGSLTPATETVVGGVIVPISGNLVVDGSGNISVPVATSSALGVVSINTTNGLSIDGNGDVDYTLPIASVSVLGGVKQGSNVIIDGSGVLTVSTSSFPIATSSSLGTIIVPGGDGLSIDGSGNLTFSGSGAIATTTILGEVIVPTSGNLVVDGSGNISVPVAENSTLGVVKSANTNYITLTSGALSIGPNVAKKDTPNTYTGAQNVQSVTLVSNSNISIDATSSNTFEVVLTTNATFSNPTGLINGGTYLFVIKQDSSGGRTLGFGSSFKFPKGIIPSITTAGNAVDILSCISDGTSLFCSINKDLL
jgi:hypothetical protein